MRYCVLFSLISGVQFVVLSVCFFISYGKEDFALEIKQFDVLYGNTVTVTTQRPIHSPFIQFIKTKRQK